MSKFRQAFVAKLEAEGSKLTELSHELFDHLFDEFVEVDKRLVYYDEKLTTVGQNHPECQRLLTIPGIGLMTATALVAAVSDAEQFHNGRQFAAWLGLVPRQHTTGGKERLLGISKRGDCYIRKLLVHGARATIQWVGSKTDRRSHLKLPHIGSSWATQSTSAQFKGCIRNLSQSAHVDRESLPHDARHNRDDDTIGQTGFSRL